MVEGRRKHVFRFVVWTCLQTSLWDAFEECKWLGPKPKMHRFCRLSGCQSSEKKIIWDLLCFFIVHVLCSIIQTSWPGRHWKMALLFMVWLWGDVPQETGSTTAPESTSFRQWAPTLQTNSTPYVSGPSMRRCASLLILHAVNCGLIRLCTGIMPKLHIFVATCFFSLCKLNCSSRTELIGSFIFGVVCCGLVNCIWVILFSLCFYFMVFMRWSVWILFGLCTVLIFFVACTWNLCDLLVVTSFVVA